MRSWRRSFLSPSTGQSQKTLTWRKGLSS